MARVQYPWAEQKRHVDKNRVVVDMAVESVIRSVGSGGGRISFFVFTRRRVFNRLEQAGLRKPGRGRTKHQGVGESEGHHEYQRG